MNVAEVKKDGFTQDKWIMLVILMITTIALGIARDGISAIFPYIKTEFALTRTQIGWCTTSLYLSSTAMGVFSGRIVDILGTKTGMFLGVVGIIPFLWFFLIVNSFFMILILVFLIGFSISLITPATSKGVVEAFPASKRAVCMGLTQAGIGIGSTFIALTLPLFSKFYGWRTGIVFSGLLLLLIAIIIRVKYPIIKSEDESKIKKRNTLYLDLLKFIKNKTFVSICFLGLVFGIGFGVVNTHFILYLYQDHLLTKTEAGWGFAILHLGGIIGRIGWGYLDDRLLGSNRKTGLLLISISLCTTMFVAGMLTENNYSLVILLVLAFILGVSALGFFGLFGTYVGEFVHEKQVGFAVGLSTTFCRLGLFVGPPLFGYIADVRGSYASSWFTFGSFILITSSLLYLIIFKLTRQMDTSLYIN